MAKITVPKTGALDFVSLGALVHRLDPGVVPFHHAKECTIHVSGGEFNCAANLADCFGLKTAIVSAMVDYPVGALIARQVRAMGVTPFYKTFEHNGVNGPNMATVYSDRGYGSRAPEVFYNRANEAAALLKVGDIDWTQVFAGGVRWFHSGGIFASLSATLPDLIIEGMQAAKEAGAVVSFDLNYREKLWQNLGGKRAAVAVFNRILPFVDVLVGTDIPSENESTERKDPEAAIASIHERYPHIKIVATTRRHEYSANRHDWYGIASIDGKMYTSPKLELDVYDRVGSGDGFASGLFYGLLADMSPDEALRMGWAHGGLLTSFPGDTSMATLQMVREIAHGGSAKIRR